MLLPGFLIGWMLPPYTGGLYYGLCGDHADEQAYLDKCIAHLRDMRTYCDDPDLQGILDYTIRRYNKVGPWDVMIFPLGGHVKPGHEIIGCNEPFCPGITLDTSLLLRSPEETALVIVHEAIHDYWPYYGHAHVTPREKKLEALSLQVSIKKHFLPEEAL